MLGSVFKVYGTVPIGNGSTVLMDVTIDGSVSPTVAQTTGSADIFSDLFYQSASMESTVWHSVTITNLGGSGNADFQFDRVELDAPDIMPSITPIGLTTTPASTTSTTADASGGASSGSQPLTQSSGWRGFFFFSRIFSHSANH